MEKFLNTPLHYGIKPMIDIENMKYIVGHSKEYDNFGSAKKDFFEKLELVIESNKLNIQLGLSPEYPSPLWDEKEGY